ncbi:MAG: 3-deoxy-D-manno-octulosonic acid transferase [Alphaproteobacteria bacterium]|nr:3-deoxy-D-manno-octulosonic acid transferase [Alphaproteobacteria bacterium]MBU1514459.1 3-deoxy-D-manno-octulosonic acid transferase [Alphaproteobacteria bacterium]MBU2096909.1 3-deoxy-D-manno-octulosonic acid transferase [Alphaproteobacteria bacterium]MBU2153536.1 3-deoxy-D-manno-octulosonic acid transferase [Alphaproteobacteria bacterium]MBU2305959.1 3-deoxy-D-manno-octulosonic acid transferase [Alphaproteobacteria bacterium]
MSPTLPLALYGAATGLLEPFAPAVLRARRRRGKEEAFAFGERLGRPATPRPNGQLVWFHGASVGETMSLLAVIKTLRERRPDLLLLLTFGTVTAARMVSQHLPSGVFLQYAPIDTPRAVRGFLDHWRPSLGVFAESELWPNLILTAKARGVRLALLSARMTQGSADRWARWPASARALLDAFDLILPQDQATEARLRRLGATPGPLLNLKAMGEPLPADPRELEGLRAVTLHRKVVLAASTHPGEEAMIAQAFHAAVPELGEAVLIVVPRHPDRGVELAEALGATRRGAGDAPTSAIHVADTLGELGLFFRLADVVVMGGSFLPGIGGHNPLEPARIGRPIITGPHAFNAADVYAALFAEAAAIEATDGAALTRHIRGLLDNPVIARRMGEAALAFADRQSEALDQALNHLEPLLPA